MSDIKRKLADNIKHVKERICCACVDAGRDPSEVTLVAVTKYVDIEIVRRMLELGVTDFAESRVQALTARADAMSSLVPPPKWHLVGHLQRNKVKQVLPWVSMFQSVDSLRLAEELDSAAEQKNCVVDVLMQINISGERSKTGVAVGASTHMAECIASLSHLRLRGLMAMGPLTEDRSAIRAAFVRCRELFEEIANEVPVGDHFRDLSMGMSDDFELGIANGATIVRIGRALFEGVAEPTPEPESNTAATGA